MFDTDVKNINRLCVCYQRSELNKFIGVFQKQQFSKNFFYLSDESLYMNKNYNITK